MKGKAYYKERMNPKNEKFIKRKISYMLPAERNNRSIGQQRNEKNTSVQNRKERKETQPGKQQKENKISKH
jgi:hypothetical protein